jgi:hypothetical protein
MYYIIAEQKRYVQAGFFYRYLLELAGVGCTKGVEDRPYPSSFHIFAVVFTHGGASYIDVAGEQRELADLFLQRHERQYGVHPGIDTTGIRFIFLLTRYRHQQTGKEYEE